MCGGKESGHTLVLISDDTQGKGKDHPTTGQQGPRGEVEV
jgi:hypothetical protein